MILKIGSGKNERKKKEKIKESTLAQTPSSELFSFVRGTFVHKKKGKKENKNKRERERGKKKRDKIKEKKKILP